MLYKIDYKHHDRTNRRYFSAVKWVNNVADETEAVKAFMGWFFREHPNDSVMFEGSTCVEMIGDLNTNVVGMIDAALKEN